jgi:hypothetical protein
MLAGAAEVGLGGLKFGSRARESALIKFQGGESSCRLISVATRFENRRVERCAAGCEERIAAILVRVVAGECDGLPGGIVVGVAAAFIGSCARRSWRFAVMREIAS